MNFNYSNIESFALHCKKCGDRVCICCHDISESKWMAHCMSCENNIGHSADSKFEACKRWNDLNRQSVVGADRKSGV